MKKQVLSSLFILFLPFCICAQIPDTEQLRESDKNQSRDLSIPGSRLVLNPFAFYNATPSTTPSDFSNHPSLPLNIGYLSTERIGERRIDNALLLYRYKGQSSASTLETGWQADLTSTVKWYPENGSKLEIIEEGLKMSVNSNANPSYKSLTTTNRISIDLDKTPILTLYMPQASGKWSLKIRNTQNEEVTLRTDASGTGTFEYDLRELTTWKGNQRISFNLWAIGLNSYFVLGDMRFIGINGEEACEEAVSYSTEWLPNELPFKATYSDGTTLTGTDFFYDKNTIARQIKFDPSNNNSSFILAGYYAGKDISVTNDILKTNNGTFSFAVKSDVFSPSEIIFYKSKIELKSQINGSSNPGYGPYWAVKFNINLLQKNELKTAVAFSYSNDNEASSTITNRINAPFNGDNMQTQYTERKMFWNNFLKKVPCPSNFSIETVDNYGITAEQVRRDYYNAWVFVAQNVLEPDPVHFPYPQVVTGKGSMWDESDDRAPYSATWESFFGIQFYAFIDPETAWNAFEGLMSLTDKDGVIGGESLPSRKAQTAWILYQTTQDKERLEKIYAPLERYLNWRLVYPHWIYNSYPDKNKKDAEFAFSAIIDIDYMIKISEIIRDEQTANEWRTKQKDFYNQCLPWFWRTPTTFPSQYYDLSTQGRSEGHPYWVTSGLHMNLLSGDYLESLYSLFSFNFNPKKNFGGSGMGFPKYPDVSYTLYGLLEHQKTKKAENVIDACIRDICRSGGWFSEQYETTDTPYPTGVRPSLFGASMIIDFVMIKNGFRYDMGVPYIQNLFRKAATISGIRYGNDVLNIECDTEGNYSISGSYINTPRIIRTNYGESVPVYKDGNPSQIKVNNVNDEIMKISNNYTSSPFVSIYVPLNQIYSLYLYDLKGSLQAILANQKVSTESEKKYYLNNYHPQPYLICLHLPGELYSNKVIVSH